VKPPDISGIKVRISENKINELEKNNKNKNIRDLYGGIHEFKRGYHALYHHCFSTLI
jgi:hypothetical protein